MVAVRRPHRWVKAGLALALLALTACRSASRSGDSWLFFPPPPAEPRVQYLTYVSGAEELEPQHGSFAKFVLGDEPAVNRAIQKPYGIAARDGVAYVCDTKGLSLVRLDFVRKSFTVIGASGPGKLRKPLNIVIDPMGYKFVVDSERRQVVVFSPQDGYVTALDVPEPCHPVDLALFEDELYVLDNDESCQIVVMKRETGEVLRTIGGPGGEPGKFRIPNSIAISPQGDLYVSDTHNWRIQKLKRDGTPVWQKGQPGYRLGQFGRPRGIRVGPDGIVYVVDGATEIVQMYDPDGNILMRFGGPGDTPGALGLPATLSVDTSSIPFFEQYVHAKFKVEYLLFVASQYGARLVNVYAFGSFPEGFQLDESRIRTLPAPAVEEGIGPARESPSGTPEPVPDAPSTSDS